MNVTWISLFVAIVLGITKLLTYLLGKKRRIRQLRNRLNELEKELRQALARNDTVRISTISLELDRVRKQLFDNIG